MSQTGSKPELNISTSHRVGALLLDLDGTIADSLSVMEDAYRDFLQARGVMPSRAEFDRLNGPPLAEVVRLLKEAHGLPGTVTSLLEDYSKKVDNAYLAVRPFGDAMDLLCRAKAADCVVGVVTSNGLIRSEAWLKRVGLAAWVDFVVAADHVVCGKPDPEPYRIATIRCCLPVDEIVAVEDSLNGVRSALGAGLRTVLIDRTGTHTQTEGVLLRLHSCSQLSDALWGHLPDSCEHERFPLIMLNSVESNKSSGL